MRLLAVRRGTEHVLARLAVSTNWQVLRQKEQDREKQRPAAITDTKDSKKTLFKVLTPLVFMISAVYFTFPNTDDVIVTGIC